MAERRLQCHSTYKFSFTKGPCPWRASAEQVRKTTDEFRFWGPMIGTATKQCRKLITFRHYKKTLNALFWNPCFKTALDKWASGAAHLRFQRSQKRNVKRRIIYQRIKQNTISLKRIFSYKIPQRQKTPWVLRCLNDMMRKYWKSLRWIIPCQVPAEIWIF